MKKLKEEVSSLKGLIDDADCYERKDTVILSGSKVPQVVNGENCIENVRKIIKSELKLEISPNEISTAHRLGPKPNSQAADKRSFIVKLCRRDLKRELIIASKKQASPIGLYVNESITPTRQSILYTLRQIKRSHPQVLSGCTSIEGRVYAFTKPAKPAASTRSSRDTRHLVNTREALQKFCNEVVKEPLERFLQNYSV